MSKSSLRIVLVDPGGDVLFSGESMGAGAPAEETAPCPQTLRSPRTASDQGEAEQDEAEEIRSPRRRTRAA